MSRRRAPRTRPENAPARARPPSRRTCASRPGRTRSRDRTACAAPRRPPASSMRARWRRACRPRASRAPASSMRRQGGRAAAALRRRQPGSARPRRRHQLGEAARAVDRLSARSVHSRPEADSGVDQGQALARREPGRWSASGRRSTIKRRPCSRPSRSLDTGSPSRRDVSSVAATPMRHSPVAMRGSQRACCVRPCPPRRARQAPARTLPRKGTGATPQARDSAPRPRRAASARCPRAPRDTRRPAMPSSARLLPGAAVVAGSSATSSRTRATGHSSSRKRRRLSARSSALPRGRSPSAP